MSNGAINFFACGTSRRGSSRGKQIVYYKYLNNCDDVKENLNLNNCDDVKENLTVWLRQRNIILNPMKDKSKIKFPLLRIMYLDDVEEQSLKEDFIEKEIQEMGFRDLLVLIHEDFKPRRQVEDNVIQLRSEDKEICHTRQNKEEFDRMMRFIQEKERMIAFSYDREKADKMLEDAVKFIEKECNIRLVDVNNPKGVKNVKGKEESPLVVFCKNDSQLQEDIENAEKNVRSGSDVMLLVLTNRKDMHLVDTIATKGFYMKSQLIFSSMRKRFCKKNNMECILWLHKFIELSGCNVSRKLSRSESFQRSFRKLRKREKSGFYKKLHNVSEEMEKRAVIYFQEKQNLFLLRMESDCEESRPFILFCRDGESAEDDINHFIKKGQVTSDLHMTVVVLLRCERQKPVEILSVPNIQRLSILSSQEPTILPTLVNDRVANKVRELLLAKMPDKTKEPVTSNPQKSTEEESKTSVATNSMNRQPDTSKYVTQHDMRGSAQDRHESPACDTDKSSLEEKNRSCEKKKNQDKKPALLPRQEIDQEIKNDLNPALKTRMTSQVPAPSKDPKINASKTSAHRHTHRPAKERDTKNEGESNTRADTKHDNQETLQAGFQGQTSSISEDTLHESSRPSKVNDAPHPTPDAITKKSRISESENEDKKITQNVAAVSAKGHSSKSQQKSISADV